MSTETQKRRDTMSVLEKLRAEGTPKRGAPGSTGGMSSKYRNEFTEEGLPLDEEQSQDEFEKQRAARTEQSLANEIPAGPTATAYNALADVGQGPTGMSNATAENPGMVPYSPEEYDRRSSFSKLEMPSSKRKKKDEEEDLPDDAAQTTGGY